MSLRSIKLRLVLAACATLVAAMLVVAALLIWLFDRHVHERLGEEIGHHMNQLAALLTLGPSEPALDGEMVDPRFDKPLGGLYWQVDRGGQSVLRSRSLWDEQLTLNSNQMPGITELVPMSGPGGRPLLARVRMVSLGSQASNFRLVVAIDADALASARRRLAESLVLGLLGVFLALLVAAWWQIHYGLRPFNAVRGSVERVRGGIDRAIDAIALPDEVQPLAREINELIADQIAATERARAQSGNLAHGLKTPLAAIAAEADRLRHTGVPAAAEHLERQIANMQRHVERHLALARSLGGRRSTAIAATKLGERLAESMASLRNLPTDRLIDWRLTGELDALARIDGDDFDEIVGNLLDNARKWAISRIDVCVGRSETGFVVTIADDGAGISDDDLTLVRQRGVRLDERVAGSGLGLSIAEAILETYGCELQLGRASIGGLKATFTLKDDQQAHSRSSLAVCE